MRKILIFMLVLMLLLAGCKEKSPVMEHQGSEVAKEASDNNETTTDINSSPDKAKDGVTLPDSYPKELPLAADAEIIDVRENPASKGLEVSYVSDNNIDTLHDFYEGALKDGENLNTIEMPDGYMITAKLNDVDYSIMISKDAMNSNPKYTGKVSVYIIITGL